MCQSCADGGNRCQSDTSMARRHRRKNNSALANVTATEPNHVYAEPSALVFTSFDDIKMEAKSIKDALASPVLDDLAAQDAIDNQLETRVTSLGMALALEAETRIGFDKKAFTKEYDQVSPAFDVAAVEYAEELEKLESFQLNNGVYTLEDIEEDELRAEYQKVLEVFNEKLVVYELESKKDDEVRQGIYDRQIDKLTASYRNIISEIREVGGELEVDSLSSKDGLHTLNETVGKDYPSAWIAASNSKGDNLRVKLADKRAHYKSESLQSDLSPEDHPDDTENSYDFFYAIPVPEDEISSMKEILGEEARILDGRPVLLNGDTCRILQMPHQRIFDPETDPTENGIDPSGDGWNFAHYIDPKTRRASNAKGWVKNTSKSLKVMRPELMVHHLNETNSRDVRSSAYHEFAHRAEGTVGNGVIMRQEEAWLRRRTTDPISGEREDVSPIYPLLPNMGILDMEIGRRNTFVIHYVGKEYVASHHREVLSVGAEAVFGGSFSALHGLDGKTKADPDHKGFVLGILATA